MKGGSSFSRHLRSEGLIRTCWWDGIFLLLARAHPLMLPRHSLASEGKRCVVLVWSQNHVQTLQPHGLQHTRLLCPLLSLRVCWNSCPLSWWCYLTISSSATHFFCLQSFPASGALSWQWRGNKLAVCIRWPKHWSFSFSFSLSISPSNEYTGLISFRINWFVVKGLSRVFSNTAVQKHQFFSACPSLWSNSHMTTRKTIAK